MASAKRQMSLAAIALMAALPPGSSGPSVQRDGLRMSDEDREHRNAERDARASTAKAKAQAKRERRSQIRRRRASSGDKT